MPTLNPFTLYDVLMGTLAGLGLVYLLYLERTVVGSRRFLVVTTTGLLVFAVGSPLCEVFAPSAVHFTHGIGALLVVAGLYDPVHNDLRKDEWADLVLTDPDRMRHPAEWMTPMDDRILDLFHTSPLVLTPSIIALNIDRSREEVNRRLTVLEEHSLVERVDRGKYRLSYLGQQYLQGKLYSTDS